MSQDVFVGAGSNIEAEINIPRALDALMSATRVTGVSIFYRSPAVGRPRQAPFTNGVFRISWDGTADELKFDCLRVIETALGRVRSSDRHADRTIDLDILIFGRQGIRDAGLTAPDTDILQRSFVYIPLLELAPDVCIPGDGPLSQLIPDDVFPATVGLQPAVALTEGLREKWRRSMGRRCFKDPD